MRQHPQANSWDLMVDCGVPHNDAWHVWQRLRCPHTDAQAEQIIREEVAHADQE